MEIIYRKLNDIKPYPNNPRHNDEAVSRVAESIREFGFKVPIVVDRTGEIVAGHTRYKAAKTLKLKEVPCIVANDLTEEQIKAFRLADNRTSELSEWDFWSLDMELKGIEEIDMELFGFDENDLIDFENLSERAGEDDEEYKEFEEKFKPKKTTDDCYTPIEIYDAVKQWVISEYGISEDAFIVRPFYPGGDYETCKYPEGCVVIDNPPFSILADIVRFYEEKNIDYFLFGPTLTLFTAGGISKYVVTGAGIVYENGASVNTSFLTNMGEWKIRTAPELYEKIRDIQGTNKAEPKSAFKYPANVTSAALLQKLAANGAELKIKEDQCEFIRALDAQRETGDAIFGAGFLLSTIATQAKDTAESEAEAAKKHWGGVHEWQLSDRELEIIRQLDAKESENGET